MFFSVQRAVKHCPTCLKETWCLSFFYWLDIQAWSFAYVLMTVSSGGWRFYLCQNCCQFWYSTVSETETSRGAFFKLFWSKNTTGHTAITMIFCQFLPALDIFKSHCFLTFHNRSLGKHFKTELTAWSCIQRVWLMLR